MEELQVQIALHGAVVLFVSLIAGRSFSRAINAQNREVAWRVVHSGGSMGGTLLLALSGVLELLALTQVWLQALVWSFVIGTWGLVVGMIVAAITGCRGLQWGTSGVGNCVFGLYVVGAVFTTLGTVLLIGGLIRAL